MEVVKMAFRPEFINRLDDILLFHRLTREHMTGIVEGAIADGETVRVSVGEGGLLVNGVKAEAA